MGKMRDAGCDESVVGLVVPTGYGALRDAGLPKHF
jgi:Na+/H+-dicarboxylate symporter